MRAVRLAFFEIAGINRHLIGHMGEAEDRLTARPGEGVERRRLHLDRQDIQIAAALDCHGGFPERRVGRPGCAAVY